MYVSEKDLQTIMELTAFVDGALESADDSEYWLDLSKRATDLQDKMKNQQERDANRRLVNKYVVLRAKI